MILSPDKAITYKSQNSDTSDNDIDISNIKSIIRNLNFIIFNTKSPFIYL